MEIRKYLRVFAFSLVVASPMLLQTGCGGGDASDDPNATKTPEEEAADVTIGVDDPTITGEEEKKE